MSMERLMGGITTHKPLVASTATLGSGCDFMAIRAAPVRILRGAPSHSCDAKGAPHKQHPPPITVLPGQRPPTGPTDVQKGLALLCVSANSCREFMSEIEIMISVPPHIGPKGNIVLGGATTW